MKLQFLSTFLLYSFTEAVTVNVDFSSLGFPYEGIGALSGGGGVTRLLIDYTAQVQSDIYDLLFLPKKGASLQLIKVEIGGDTQSTEGTEMSHEHVRGDLNCSRGYEWNVLVEARKRNPAIKTFGLSWGVPAWIGNNSYYAGTDNLKYHIDWLACARNTHQVEIDYMGIWNERQWDNNWIKELRSTLDSNGFQNTRIVAADNDFNGIINDMVADPTLAAAIDVIGAHYPSPAPPADGFALDKPLWASECWDLAKVDDWDGALTLAIELHTHARFGLSRSVIWCLIYSWYALLPFSRVDSSNAGSGHSLMTAAEPWSGHYEVSYPLAMVAHFTQFADPGWIYLNNTSSGMGDIAGIGSITTFVNTNVPSGVLEFSVVIETSNATVATALTLQLAGLASGVTLPLSLFAWRTSQQNVFVQIADAIVNSDGTVPLMLEPQSVYSFTTTTGQGWATPSVPIAASQPFPFPYFDDFSQSPIHGYSKYWSDLGGIFQTEIIPPSLGGDGNEKAYYQVVITNPGANAWEKNPSPYTILGNFNGGSNQSAWTDYAVSVRAAIDPDVNPLNNTGSNLVGILHPCGGTSYGTYTVVSGDVTLNTPSLLESVAHPGWCVGIDSSITPPYVPGAALSLVDCAAAIRGVRDPSYRRTTKLPLTIDATDGSTTPLTWQRNTTTNQIFNAATGYCLDILSGSNTDNSTVFAYPCKASNDPNGIGNEQWTIVQVSAATIQLRDLNGINGTLCLDMVQDGDLNVIKLMLTGRMNQYIRNGAPPGGYNLFILPSNVTSPNGVYVLQAGKTVLATGSTLVPIFQGVFYELALQFKGTTITALLNNVVLTSVQDSTYSFGMVGIGCGWHNAWFDSFSVGNLTSSK
jgi:hypothetical protein